MVKMTPSAKPKSMAAKVVIDIRPGPVSPAMRRAWVTFWNRLIASAKREVGQ